MMGQGPYRQGGLQQQRLHVVMLCPRDDTPVVRALLEGSDFTIARLVVATPMALLLLQPDVLLACCVFSNEVKRIRQMAPHVPLVICSPSTEEAHIVNMLDAGADDYISLLTTGKDEAQARLHRHVRRSRACGGPFKGGHGGPLLALESEDQQILLNLQERTMTVREQTIRLSTTECAILFLLMREGGKVIASTVLLQAVWGVAYRTEVDYLRVYMRQLRRKIEVDPKHPVYLETVSGVGYRFSQPCFHISA